MQATGCGIQAAGCGGGQPSSLSPLPPLREELRLLPAPALADGSPAWTLHDPIGNRFFRLGWLEFEILQRWHGAAPEKIIADINRDTTLTVNREHLERLRHFLRGNHLLQPVGTQAAAGGRHTGPGPLRWLLRHYLYLRLPLLHPDRFLAAALPRLAFLFSRRFLYLTLAAGILALFLTLRQWESFRQTFLYFFSVQGLIFYALLLFAVKIMHELGHGFMAKRYGLRVPVMGVALMVLWPVLYTDTSDAWRLTSRRQRLAIGAAGILTEMMVATYATLLWNFLADGPWRSCMFLLATTTWVTTLAVNLNPFMRFDGYYLLADFLDIPNLQERSFALGRWRLRALVLGLREPCPEQLPGGCRRLLILYGYATWLYRLLLFFSIALLVYHFFFKALGLVLMAVEIGWFIALPIGRELRSWWRLRAAIRCNARLLGSILILAAFLFLLVYPWNTYLETPAFYGPGSHARIFPAMAGRVEKILARPGQRVQAGDTLFVLSSPALEFLTQQTTRQISALKLQLKRLDFVREEADSIQVVQSQLTEALTALEGYRQQTRRLAVTSPIAGEILELDETLTVGQWLNENHALALVVEQGGMMVEGMVREDDLERVRPGLSGRFYPVALEAGPVEVVVRRVDPADIAVLSKPYLASIYGGPIPVRPVAGRLVSHGSWYRVLMEPGPQVLPPRIIRGTARLKTEPLSLLSRLWRPVAAVLIRESEF